MHPEDRMKVKSPLDRLIISVDKLVGLLEKKLELGPCGCNSVTHEKKKRKNLTKKKK